MDYKNYMHKLVQSFRDNRTTQFMFIKHYDTLLISEKELHDIIIDETSEVCLLFHAFPMHNMQAAFAPFLVWIRELYFMYFKDETPEEFVKNAQVYSLLQPVFSSYIATGVASRTEDILITERDFERDMMIKSLINIYNYISERKAIFIFLEKLHLANSSCMRFLYALVNSQTNPRLQILAMYNELYRTSDYLQSDWKLFRQLIEKKNLQYEWNSVSTESTIDVQDVFIPRNAHVRDYVQTAANMYFFLTLEDAKHYLDIIYNHMKQGNLEMEVEVRAQFYEIFALILLFVEEYTRALQMCECVGGIAKELKDDKLLYEYYYLSAISQYGMEQLENKVELYVDRCQEIARKHHDELAEYKAEIIRNVSNFNYWRDAFKKQYSYRVSKDFMEKTEKFGFQNILAHMLVYAFDDDEETVEAVKQGNGVQESFEKGIALGHEIGNQQFLLSAYTKNIVLFSEYGCYSYVDMLYQKKLKLLDGESQLIRRAHTYNGLGYNAGVAERYQQAEEYFAKSLGVALQLKDGEEIAITLYNCSINKMLAGEFPEAAEDLNLLLQVMELLQIHSLNICDTSRIYALLGFCSFYMGEEYRCYLCLNRIEAYVCHLEHIEDENKYKYWNNTLFLQHMIRALLFSQEDRIDDVEEELEQAKFHMDAEPGSMYFNYPLFITEVAKIYGKQNRIEERNEILEKGILFCNEKGYHLRENHMLNMLKNKNDYIKKTLPYERDISNKQIIEVVTNLAVEKQLAMNKKDIDFMVIWQELLAQKLSSEEMLTQAVSMMKNYFNLDGVVMFSCKKGKSGVDYFVAPESNGSDTMVTDCIRNFTELEIEKLFDYFTKHRRPLLINRIDKGFLEYKDLLNLLDINHIITLYASPFVNDEGKVTGVLMGYVEMRKSFIGQRYLLMEHDFVILKFFSNQLYVALERLDYLELINRMNSQLHDMAVTDLLTGLYNRQGFEKRIEEDQKNEIIQENIIIYIDLDNFKYYNDTFGHELGDFVLVRFAQLLERAVEDHGYAVRYGGDEFLLVLNGKDIEFGKHVARNIIYMMHDNFNTIIERKVGYGNMIPHDKRLSCSIGIASYDGYDMDKVQEALNKADKGIYYVKKTTKNNFVVWDELKES